ncbi:MAG: hypothetical protein ACFE0Q_01805 [Anaerolineae bacterium]
MQRLLNFFQNILNGWDRFKQFDFRELTLMQIFFGVAGVLVALWIFGQILSFVLGILNIVGPIALVSMMLVIGYRWSQSRSEDIPDEMKKSKKERAVDEAFATVTSHDDDGEQRVAVRAEVEAEADTITVEPEVDEDKLVIKQVVNPETGFKEPDISRLIEHEEAKLKEADKVNDEIMAQIEARRKRLKEG